MKALFWVLLGLAASIHATMLLWTFPALRDAAGGLDPFDLRPFGYSVAEAQAYLAAISEEGLAIYLGAQHLLDLFYPAVLAGMFAAGALILLPRWLAVPVIVVAVTGAVADYSENALVARMLTGPSPDAALIGRASMATMVKSGCATVGFVALLSGGARAALRRYADRA